MKLLEIQSSVREVGSISRSLSDEFVKTDQPGILNTVEGNLQSTFSFEFSGESIKSIFAIVNPEKLKGVKL